MFTLQEIKAAHSKVKSGADFPAYIQDLKKLGIIYYDTFVADGHADYYGTDDYKISSPAVYDSLPVTERLNKEQFKADLKAHQNGNTDYFTFCNDAAKSGVHKWEMCLQKMDCTYYDHAGNEILKEKVPG
ncbi:DUF1398 domain-containing protein [Elizabethkingia meningoseptica]|uniref:DUF1398 domain-containing protein n=1 Tax=Elizabethkingia meningoseptica TaxID=238 RepID=UPI00301600EB